MIFLRKKSKICFSLWVVKIPLIWVVCQPPSTRSQVSEKIICHRNTSRIKKNYFIVGSTVCFVITGPDGNPVLNMKLFSIKNSPWNCSRGCSLNFLRTSICKSCNNNRCLQRLRLKSAKAPGAWPRCEFVFVTAAEMLR